MGDGITEKEYYDMIPEELKAELRKRFTGDKPDFKSLSRQYHYKIPVLMNMTVSIGIIEGLSYPDRRKPYKRVTDALTGKNLTRERAERSVYKELKAMGELVPDLTDDQLEDLQNFIDQKRRELENK